MANPKYKLKNGKTRTPEEHRKILQEIDDLQRLNSALGVVKSTKRIISTFGVSATQYKKSIKPKRKVIKVYNTETYYID